MHQQVVGDQGDRDVHEHEHGDPLGRLAHVQDVEVGQQQDQGHQDGQAEEQPPRRRADPRHDRPGHARDDHAGHGQLGIVGELEVREIPGAGENGFADDDQDGVGRQRSGDRGGRRQQDPPGGRLAVRRGEVHAGQGRELIQHGATVEELPKEPSPRSRKARRGAQDRTAQPCAGRMTCASGPPAPASVPGPASTSRTPGTPAVTSASARLSATTRLSSPAATR